MPFPKHPLSIQTHCPEPPVTDNPETNISESGFSSAKFSSSVPQLCVFLFLLPVIKKSNKSKLKFTSLDLCPDVVLQTLPRVPSSIPSRQCCGCSSTLFHLHSGRNSLVFLCSSLHVVPVGPSQIPCFESQISSLSPGNVKS